MLNHNPAHLWAGSITCIQYMPSLNKLNQTCFSSRCLSYIFFNIKYIPFSGRNPVFHETLDVKPHVLILNKMDLADLSNKQVRGLGAVSAMLLSCLEVTDTKWQLYIHCAENPEDARKSWGEQCCLHRLFKAKRRQHQTGKHHLRCVVNTSLFLLEMQI